MRGTIYLKGRISAVKNKLASSSVSVGRFGRKQSETGGTVDGAAETGAGGNGKTKSTRDSYTGGSNCRTKKTKNRRISGGLFIGVRLSSLVLYRQ